MMRTRRWRIRSYDWCPGSGRFGIPPCNEKQQLSRIVDTLEDFMIDEAGGMFVEAEPRRQMLRCDFWLVAFRRSEFAN
jgi:hypothetical protein